MADKRLLKYLEEYVFSSDKEAVLQKLLPDTDEYVYLKLTHEMVKNKGEPLSPESQEIYDRLVDSSVSSDYKKGLKIRKLFQQLSQATELKEKKSLCKKLNKLVMNFRFGHKRPKIAEGMATNTGDQVKKDSKINPSHGSKESDIVIDKNSVDESSIAALKTGYWLDRNLDDLFKLILEKNYSLFPTILNKLPTLSTVKSLIKHIVTYFKKDSSPNYETIYKRLTLTELTALGNEYKDLKDLSISYVDELYHKTFPEYPMVQNVREISILKKIYLFSLNSKLSPAYPSLKRFVLQVLLDVMARDNQTDAEFFEDFIKNPVQRDQIFSKKLMNKFVDDYTSYTFISAGAIGIPTLITSHLKLLFKQGVDISKYSEYFNNEYITKLVAELQLKSGGKIERILETFSKEELDYLNDERYLVFAEKKSEFLPGEPVALKLEIKNISKLVMKVFEINTQNYCLEQQQNVDNNVKLDGLVSISESSFKYDQAPILSHEETFILETLAEKSRGVFVVDFLGAGTTSRAVIRKGFLSLVAKKVRTGYVCKILDEKYQDCKGEGTGLFLEDKFYAAEEDGTIRLQYPSGSGQKNITLQHQGFCYVVNQNLQGEDVSITTNWIYSEETFVPGNKFSLCGVVSMIVSGQSVSLTNIKEASLTVEYTKARNIKSKFEIPVLELKDGADIELADYLPNGCTNVQISVTYNYLAQNGNIQTVNNSHSISLKDRLSRVNKTHIFLRSERDGYYLYQLGKNGERIPNTEFNIELRYIWKRDNNTHNAITDSQGRIYLGNLEGVTYVGVTAVDVKNEQLNTFFEIFNKNSSLTPTQLIRVEGESISLPVLRQFEQKGLEYSLQKINKHRKTVLEDLTKSVTKNGSFFVISKLSAGNYVFRYTKSDKTVEITVVQGEYISEDIIKKSNGIQPHIRKNQLISNVVSEVENKETNSLEIQLDKFDASTRIHVFSETFLEEGYNRNNHGNNLNGRISHFTEEPFQKVSTPKVSYLEDRQLPGEMIYAMNRKNNEAAIGTTSEKPCLFIKKQEVRATYYKTDEVTHGTDFEAYDDDFSDADEDASPDYNDYDYGSYGRKKPSYRGKAQRARPRPTNAFFETVDDYSNPNTISCNSEAVNAEQYEKIRHFLKNPSKSFLNLKPDDKGVVRVGLAGVASKTFRVFVINHENCTSSTVSLGEEAAFETSDRRLLHASDNSKMFAYERDVYQIKNSEAVAVPGFGSAEYELIDSLGKLLEIKKALSGDQLGTKWDFLKNWSTLKIKQKLTVSEEMFSYELCVFLYQKDRQFFDATFKDFIQSKVKKGLIDYYLLGNTAQLETYLDAARLGSLNALERVLLIDALHKSHPAQCQQLLVWLQGQDANNIYDDSLAFHTIFDRIINISEKRGGTIQLKRRADAKATLYDDYDDFDDGSDDEDDDDEDEESDGGSGCTPRIKPARNNNNNRNRNANCDDEESDEEPDSVDSAPRERARLRAEVEARRNYDRKEEKKEERHYVEEEAYNPAYDLFGGDDMEPQQQLQNCDDDMFGAQEQICEAPRQIMQQVYRGPAQIRRPIPRRPVPQQRQQRVRPATEECEEDEDCGAGLFGGDEEDDGSEDSHDDAPKKRDGQKYNLMDLKKRRQEPKVARLQQNSSKQTYEYREMGYFFQTRDDQLYNIDSNLFWVDLAKHLLSDRSKPFLSPNFVYVQGQTLPFALAFVDLGFEGASPKFTTTEGNTTLILEKGNGLLFLKHLKERDQVADSSNTVLAAQKWFDRDERFEYNIESGTSEEKQVDYFLTGRIYGSQVVVTNVSSVEQKIQIISEIPQGAIPIIENDFYQNQDIKLAQFSTSTLNFHFYFPTAGTFKFCPACVTREGKKVTTQISGSEVSVLNEPPKKTELKNIKDILAQGSKEDILSFMKRENITNRNVFKFEEIYWLLRDEEFYTKCIEILKEKLVIDPIVWSYSVYHGDVDTLLELFIHSPPEYLEELKVLYLKVEGPGIKKPFNLNYFTFREYHPIVNARFHQLSKEQSTILNKEFSDKYVNFLKYVFEKDTEVNIEDHLVLTYYLLLQDRIDEAYAIYTSLSNTDAETAGLKLQYDYMGAYFDLYKGMPLFTKAKAICEKYYDYPIASWRGMFIEIANQLAEIEGEESVAKTETTTEASLGTDLVLKCKVVDETIEIEYANTDTVKVEFFEVSLEILFSLHPFRTNEFDQLVFSNPHKSLSVPLTKAQALQRSVLQIPAPFDKKDMIIKVSSGKSKQVLVYSYNQLNVAVFADQGRLKITDKKTSKALSRVYVKVFAKTTGGANQFFRDGYSDIVGGFNYFDVKTGVSGVQQFGLFISDGEKGCVIMNIDAPQGGQTAVVKVALKSKKMKEAQSKMVNMRYAYAQECIDDMDEDFMPSKKK